MGVGVASPWLMLSLSLFLAASFQSLSVVFGFVFSPCMCVVGLPPAPERDVLWCDPCVASDPAGRAWRGLSTFTFLFRCRGRHAITEEAIACFYARHCRGLGWRLARDEAGDGCCRAVCTLFIEGAC